MERSGFMKKGIAVLLLLLMAALSAACMGPQEVAYVTTIPTEEPETLPKETQLTVSFSYEELKNEAFWFSSGAGGWRTELHIQPDGSFYGEYSDSNMGESGEGYTSTYYRCRFEGRFGQLEHINEYTWSLPIEALTCEKEGQEILDDVLMVYGGEAYGLEGTKNVLLYLPGAPLAQLPEYYLRWVNLYDTEETELPFYGLYNEPQESGFSSYNEIDSLRDSIAAAEERERQLEAEAADQTSMNIAASTKYEMWDSILNRIWQQLMNRLGEEEKRLLTNEELAWIKDKEQAMADAGKEVEGGTLYPTVYYGTAAAWTKERVQVLMGILEDIT